MNAIRKRYNCKNLTFVTDVKFGSARRGVFLDNEKETERKRAVKRTMKAMSEELKKPEIRAIFERLKDR